LQAGTYGIEEKVDADRDVPAGRRYDERVLVRKEDD
jgi:hypothetical protein